MAVSGSELKILIQAKDLASPAISAVNSTLRGLGAAASAPIGAIHGLVGALGQIGLAGMGVQTVVGAVQGVANSLGMGLQMEMEEVRARFQAFYKDAGKTEEVLRLVRQEADKTPFEFRELANATASLAPVAKTAGMELMDVVRIAEVLGAANPAQGLEGAAFALREAAGGDLTSVVERFDLPRQRLNELKEQGVPAIKAVQMVMAEMGYDSDLVAAKANTLSGKWSTFQDAINGVKMRLSEPIFNAAKEGLDFLSNAFNQNQGVINSWADQIAAAFAAGFDVIRGAGRAIGDVLGYLGEGNKRDLMREWFGDAGPVIDEAVRGLKTLAAIVPTIFQQLKSGNVAGALDLLGLGFANLGEKLQPAIAAIRGELAKITPPDVMAGIDAFVGGLSSTFGKLAGGLSGLIGKGDVSGMITVIFGATGDWLGGLGQLYQAIGQWIIAQVPGLVQQLQTWGAALVAWIGPMIPPLLQALGRLASQAWAWVQSQVPVWLAQLQAWGAALWGWIQPQIPVVLAQLQALAAQAWAWVQAQIPGWLAQLQAWGQALIAWIAPQIPVVLEQLQGLASQVWAWIQSAAAPLVAQLGAWAAAFGEWVVPAVQQFLADWPAQLEQILTAIGEAAGPLLVQLGKWALAFVEWLVPALPQILLALAGVAAAILVFVAETALVLVKVVKEKWLPALVDWIVTDAIPAGARAMVAFQQNLETQLGTIALGLLAQGVALAKSIVDGMVQGIVGLASQLTESISAELNKIKIDLGPFHLSVQGFKIDTPQMPSIQLPNVQVPGFAAGVSNFGGGLAVVGERGPELLSLPRGASVTPMASASAARGGTTVGSITVQVNGATGDPSVIRQNARLGVLEGLRAAGVV